MYLVSAYESANGKGSGNQYRFPEIKCSRVGEWAEFTKKYLYSRVVGCTSHEMMIVLEIGALAIF